jgi:hypothetical protein
MFGVFPIHAPPSCRHCPCGSGATIPSPVPAGTTFLPPLSLRHQRNDSPRCRRAPPSCRHCPCGSGATIPSPVPAGTTFLPPLSLRQWSNDPLPGAGGLPVRVRTQAGPPPYTGPPASPRASYSRVPPRWRGGQAREDAGAPGDASYRGGPRAPGARVAAAGHPPVSHLRSALLFSGFTFHPSSFSPLSSFQVSGFIPHPSLRPPLFRFHVSSLGLLSALRFSRFIPHPSLRSPLFRFQVSSLILLSALLFSGFTFHPSSFSPLSSFQVSGFIPHPSLRSPPATGDTTLHPAY